MNDDKIKACDLAIALIQILDTLDDENFVDAICRCIDENDYLTVMYGIKKDFE